MHDDGLPAGRQARPETYATKPTAATRFWRTFLPWQMWRFLRINLKMTRLILRSHSGR